jgi:uncharacterized membrane protein YbhN (UPF0104 family)
MRRFLVLSAKILVSATLLFFALRGVDIAAAASRLNRISPGWVILAVAFALVQVSFGAVRWREIAAHCEAPLAPIQALRYSLVGAFFNQTLPSSIGGDAVRLWLLARSAGWRAATYSVLVDRGIGLIALSIVILIALPWSHALISSPAGRTALLLLDVAAFLGGAAFLLVGQLDWHWLRHWWPTRHLHAIARIAWRALFDRRSGPILAPLSLSIHLLAVIIAFCLARAVAAPLSFTQAFLLIPPVMLVTMLPISIAGWGLREATMVAAFGYAGLAEADGLLVSLLFGLTMVIVGVIGGLAWILGGESLPRASTTVLPDDEITAP